MIIKKCQIIFFGTPGFAVPTLEALNKAHFVEIKAVITQPDKPVGRHQSSPIPSPIKQAAKELNLPVLEGLDGLRGIEADLGVVVAFGEILPQSVIDMFPLGLLNIHPSLLPKYRGTSPIQAAILNQEKETGVSIIQLDAEMDHGPILAQEKITLLSGEPPLNPLLSTGGEAFSRGLGGGLTAGELYSVLFQQGADLLVKILPDYIASKIKLNPQDDSQATYTKKLTKEDGKIDWSKSPEEIEAHVRAMNPWPGAWTIWNNKRLIVWRASLGEPGSSRPSPWPSPEGRGIALEEIQLEGKKKMAFTEFCKGHPEFNLSDFFSDAKA